MCPRGHGASTLPPNTGTRADSKPPPPAGRGGAHAGPRAPRRPVCRPRPQVPTRLHAQSGPASPPVQMLLGDVHFVMDSVTPSKLVSPPLTAPSPWVSNLCAVPCLVSRSLDAGARVAVLSLSFAPGRHWLVSGGICACCTGGDFQHPTTRKAALARRAPHPTSVGTPPPVWGSSALWAACSSAGRSQRRAPLRPPG